MHVLITCTYKKDWIKSNQEKVVICCKFSSIKWLSNSFSPYKSIRDQNPSPQCYWPFGSGEDFWRVFPIYGHGGHLGHVTQTPRTNFRSPIPLGLLMKFGFDRPTGFGEEDLWKWWTMDERTMNGWTTDHGYAVKLTNEPKGSSELKKMAWFRFQPEKS